MKNKYYKIRTYINIIRKDLKDKFPISFFKKIQLWRKGFLAEKHTLYQFDKNDHKNYFSDYHASISRNINEPFNDLLTNKLVFSEVIGKVLKVPQTYGWIFNGIYYNKDESNIENLLSKNKEIVIKAVNGGGGKDVFIIKKESNNNYVINNIKRLQKEELLQFMSTLNNFIVTEFIKPGFFSESLNKDTVNTMRIITLMDPKTNKPFIARAVQRIGVKTSAPMDNFTKGGLSAPIDLETGILGDATSHPLNSSHTRYSSHPDTGFKFEGKVIPKWNDIKSEILNGVGKLPMLKCVGWDFLLSDKGLVAIEGNHHPDPDVLQGHEPLLTDERIKAFYKFHKII
jgi:hypothetical protein